MMDATATVDTTEPQQQEERTEIRRRKPKIKRSKLVARERDLSSIAFPYSDLENAISVARAIHNQGGVGLTREQLAGGMQLQIASGNFVMKVGTARMFGLIENVQNKYQLTDLGFRIVADDDKVERAARAQAFLNIPLYRRTYEEFRGRQLPPRPLGLEQAFVQFGVAPKQKDRARIAFEKSATQAGFFQHGNDRLVEPVLTLPMVSPRDVKPDAPIIEHASEREMQSLVRAHHPLIEGLVQELPKPGEVWRTADREKWLKLASIAFELLYKEGPEVEKKN